ncbi:C1QL [Mytilus edulis]|uniref:C1QL n=1 Tax=Mytilus edulis TaxID=6550 RepID=A0A8S3QHR8_MYTED|nr:C1QL [Mytilus edulis]
MVKGHKSCSRNAGLMKSIQYQLKLVEDNDGKCDCAGRVSVITNVGNGYDKSTGIFTAPSNGVYIFSWNVLTHAGKYFFTYLTLNGKLIVRNYTGAQKIADHISSSQNVVLEIEKDDKVFIKVQDGYTGQYMIGDDWSSFSVFTKDHTIMAIFIPMILTLGLIISVVQGQIPEYYDGNRILATKGALPSGGISWVETTVFGAVVLCLLFCGDNDSSSGSSGEHWLFNAEKKIIAEITENSGYIAKSVDDNDDPDFNISMKRGYGGVAIIWKKEINENIKELIDGGNRIQAIHIQQGDKPICLINIYMPSDSKNADIEYKDTLAQIDEMIEKYKDTHEIIVCGDMNRSLDRSSTPHDKILKTFCKEKCLGNTEKCPVKETFYHQNGMSKGQIDYFLFKSNSEIINKIRQIDVLDTDPENTSDHVPVILTLNSQLKKSGKSNNYHSKT